MSILWLIAVLLLLHYCASGVCIVGGKVSIPHSRPHMVYVHDSETKESCGGFLVREDFVMTAAHCNKNHLMVYLGVSNTHHLPVGVVVHPIPHPKFNKRQPGHDIMLLKLETPATLNKTVKTIALPKTENEEISKNCMVMGWGQQDYDKMSPSWVLKEVNVTLLDSKNCGTNDTICTEGYYGPSSGDSGGPLVCGAVVQGIVSYNKDESKNIYRSRYTYIAHYFTWIYSIIYHRNIIPPTQETKQNEKLIELISLCLR
ncbi:mast cell protease 1A isoform X2 [Myxocyprinus asiaticus]|uniref:mast cell protease 1A isoform X1 n=1 Tax=Myxocyprinus asiaticus TaxID=70543 RepID=UPI0022235287|nr:mast cell protease 1A isoform X1 [Myxocyprinus asiaticus]XP_051549184.1 mast cell protease 1A isoform X2 [Myxocyprinus asiaticus]